MKECQKLNILLGVYRYNPYSVLVSFNQDFTIEQKHIIHHETIPISTQSIKECLTRIVQEMVDRSPFGEGENNADGSEETKAD